jgi:hypothetical protein
MALELKCSVYSINADCATFILQDDTAWGNPEADRTDRALYIAGFKKNNTAADTALTITPLVTDPFTVTQWQIESSKDGWHSFPMYAVPIWDNATGYVTGDAVYEGSAVYVALSANTNEQPSASPTYWSVVTDFSTIDDAGNIDFAIQDITISCRSEICYGKVVGKASSEVCKGNCDTLFGSLYREVDTLMQSANVHCQQENYAAYENDIRSLEPICTDYGPCANC